MCLREMSVLSCGNELCAKKVYKPFYLMGMTQHAYQIFHVFICKVNISFEKSIIWVNKKNWNVVYETEFVHKKLFSLGK